MNDRLLHSPGIIRYLEYGIGMNDDESSCQFSLKPVLSDHF